MDSRCHHHRVHLVGCFQVRCSEKLLAARVFRRYFVVHSGMIHFGPTFTRKEGGFFPNLASNPQRRSAEWWAGHLETIRSELPYRQNAWNSMPCLETAFPNV